MSRKRIFGPSAIAAALLGAGAAVHVGLGVVVFNPSLAASAQDAHSDPAPQRLKTAQAQSGDRSAAATLPGGASSLDETYKDWRVACRIVDNARRCGLSQVQAQQNGQRVLAVELAAPGGDAVSGILVLPFGLALDAGVVLQVDDRPAMAPLRFRTCLPAGCVVDVGFEGELLAELRAGAALKIGATADGGAEAPFSVSLHGFGTALDRVAALSR